MIRVGITVLRHDVPVRFSFSPGTYNTRTVRHAKVGFYLSKVPYFTRYLPTTVRRGCVGSGWGSPSAPPTVRALPHTTHCPSSTNYVPICRLSLTSAAPRCRNWRYPVVSSPTQLVSGGLGSHLLPQCQHPRMQLWSEPRSDPRMPSPLPDNPRGRVAWMITATVHAPIPRRSAAGARPRNEAPRLAYLVPWLQV